MRNEGEGGGSQGQAGFCNIHTEPTKLSDAAHLRSSIRAPNVGSSNRRILCPTAAAADVAAGFAEGLYAMATAQDPLAALLLCAVLLGASGLCYVFGLGAGVFVLIAVLLRPPLLRGVPGVFGWKAILSQLRGHGRSLEELAW